jgi:peptide deformylase
MPIRKIATIGNPVLRQVARPLTKDELASPRVQSFIDDLVETMFDANGAGIAANQVYEPIRVCALHVKDNPRYPYKPNIPLTVLVNPKLEILDEETFLNYEGCLSVPNLRGEVPRSVRVRVRAWDRSGAELDIEAKGITAGTYQHEVDHLDGKLFVDRVVDTRSLCTWQDFERYKQADFVARAKEIVQRFGS